MNQNRHGPEHSDISTGDVSGTGIVIGHGSSSRVNIPDSDTQHEAVALLDKFMRLLDSYADSVPDAVGARESAVAARDEVEEPSPKWHVVRGLLKGIGPGIAGFAELTEIIDNLLKLVPHIPG